MFLYSISKIFQDIKSNNNLELKSLLPTSPHFECKCSDFLQTSFPAWAVVVVVVGVKAEAVAGQICRRRDLSFCDPKELRSPRKTDRTSRKTSTFRWFLKSRLKSN
jgi:hypothetical protein